MGELTNLNSPKAIADADIPAEIARDSETAAAMAAHAGASDPHPVYLTQAEGDGRYRQTTVALTDADIPAAIARDSETAGAIAGHVGASDPHPSLWSRIVAGFLSLIGGQQVLKNNPGIHNASFLAPSNHLELATNNGSNPILGFHRGGFSATALYHAGYGSESLRIRNADGYDSALLHDANHVALEGFHSVRCSLITTVVAAVNTETIVSIGGISAAKIVGISAFILDNLGASGIFYILKGGGGDFNPSPKLLFGSVRVPAVSASQLVGKPLHILIWHIP